MKDVTSLQLLQASQVHIVGQRTVFRYSRIRAVALALLLLAMGLACFAVGMKKFLGFERYVSYYVGTIVLFALFLCRGYIIARFGRLNWLAQVTEKGVFVKFRSYLNIELPESDKTVVFIPYEQIRSVGLFDKSMGTADAQGERGTRTFRYVGIDVAADLAELSQALSEEFAKVAPRHKHWYGMTATLYSHYPVRLIAPSLLEIEWGVVPGRTLFLDALRPFVPISAYTYGPDSFEKLRKLSAEQQRHKLRELDAAGQTVLAVATARRLYGYDMAAAREFIESLRKT